MGDWLAFINQRENDFEQTDEGPIPSLAEWPWTNGLSTDQTPYLMDSIKNTGTPGTDEPLHKWLLPSFLHITKENMEIE